MNELVQQNPKLVRLSSPSALGDDLRRFVQLSYTIAVMEFKLRYFGSVLGYLWSLMRPLMLFGVLYVVFTQIVRFGSDIPNYPLYLLLGLVLWNFFAETTSAAVKCLVAQENLVRKIRFPRAVIPVSIVLQGLFNLALNMIAVIVFFLIAGVDPTLGWLELIPLLLTLVLLAAGVAMILAALYVRYRDMEMIWEVGVQMLFWGSPIIYAIQTLSHKAGRVMMVNPIATIVTQARHAMIGGHAPSAANAIGDGWLLLLPLAVVVTCAVFGFWIFDREAPTIAENL